MPISVLIVDDDPAFRRTARELLGACGYAVAGEAVDGADGIAAVRRLRPDAVLLDVQMPDRDGFEVARELTSQAEAPLVLLTSSDPGAVSGDLAEEAGAVGFVPKVELAVTDLGRYFSR